MNALLRLMWLWGIGDSAYMALDPAGWARFWGRFIGFLGGNPTWARAMAAIEFALSLYMLTSKRSR